MAVGNTFGATALSSFGGFWISFAIIFTPGGFEIQSTLEGQSAATFYDSFGLYLMVCLPPCSPSDGTKSHHLFARTDPDLFATL